MTFKPFKLYPLALPLLALTALIALPALAATTVDKTVAASPDGNVSISNVAGSVKISTWNQDKIHVSGTLGAGVKRLDVEKTDGGVDIRVVYPNFGHSQGSHITIQLPAASHLRVNTVSADISARDLTGSIKFETVSGEIKARSQSADIYAKSVSGDIDITGSAPKARVEAHSISGEVDIEHVHGELRAESVSGDIDIDGNNTVSRATLNTTSGEIEFEAAITGHGDYELHSVSGDVKLNFPKTPAARFDVTTLSGDIAANFGPAPKRTSQYGPGKTWQFQNGKARVNISTTSGDVRIHAKH